MPNIPQNAHLRRIAIFMHVYNQRVNVGWSVYLAPYISMLNYLALMEIVVAKLFPDLFTSATALAVASYAAFIWLSHALGRRHERVEALNRRMRPRRSAARRMLR